MRTFFQGSQHLVDTELHKRYGRVVRVGPNNLLCSDMEAYQAIYSFKPTMEKGDFYLMTGNPEPDKHVIFQARTEEAHRQKRKKLVPTAVSRNYFSATPRYAKLCFKFSTNNIAEYEVAIEKDVDSWRAALDAEKQNTTDDVEMADSVRRLLADTSASSSPDSCVAAIFDVHTASDVIYGRNQGFIRAGYDKYGQLEDKRVMLVHSSAF